MGDNTAAAFVPQPGDKLGDKEFDDLIKGHYPVVLSRLQLPQKDNRNDPLRKYMLREIVDANVQSLLRVLATTVRAEDDVPPFQAIRVCEIDGRVVIVDGYHRTSAMQAFVTNKGFDRSKVKMPAIWYHPLSTRQVLGIGMLCCIVDKGALPLKRLDLLSIGRTIMDASSSAKLLGRIRESQNAVGRLMSGLDMATMSSKSREAKTTIRTFKGDLKIYMMLQPSTWHALMEWFVPVRNGELEKTPQQAVGNSHDLSFASLHELLRDHPLLSSGRAAWAKWEEELRERLHKSTSASIFTFAFPKSDDANFIENRTFRNRKLPSSKRTSGKVEDVATLDTDDDDNSSVLDETSDDDEKPAPIPGTFADNTPSPSDSSKTEWTDAVGEDLAANSSSTHYNESSARLPPVSGGAIIRCSSRIKSRRSEQTVSNLAATGKQAKKASLGNEPIERSSGSGKRSTADVFQRSNRIAAVNKSARMTRWHEVEEMPASTAEEEGRLASQARRSLPSVVGMDYRVNVAEHLALSRAKGEHLVARCLERFQESSVEKIVLKDLVKMGEWQKAFDKLFSSYC